jgi:hypothetical protein
MSIACASDRLASGYCTDGAGTWCFDHSLKNAIRATAAKEVGMKNPAEKTAVRPNQNPKSIRPLSAHSKVMRGNGP